MELQVGVKAILKNQSGLFLLLRRSEIKYPGAGGMWDIPGGRIDIGTPLLENLKREIKEETSLDLTEIPKLIAAQDIFRSSEKHIVRLTYLGSIEGKPKTSEEHDAFKWFSKEEIKNLTRLDSYIKELITQNLI
ncbi:MAG: NUDIX domain-containing protein [Candidatus Paceibacterota bacterium]|jgi:ADP-ribose pyrophosphatase YjhB (NUDIX family)